MTIRSVTKSPWLAVLSALLGAWSAPGWALQVRDAVDGQNILVQVSAREPSRIVIEGQDIRAATADEESVVLHRDEKDPQGHIFVRPKDPKRHSTVFISTNTGAYSLLLQPADVPAETILIRDRSRRAPPKLEQSASRVTAAKSLVVVMARDESPSDLEVRDNNQDFALWQEVRFRLLRSWLGMSLVGERWRLENITDAPVSVLEQEFFKPGVVAVAVDQHHIAAGQAAHVFIVRERKSDE